MLKSDNISEIVKDSDIVTTGHNRMWYVMQRCYWPWMAFKITSAFLSLR